MCLVVYLLTFGLKETWSETLIGKNNFFILEFTIHFFFLETHYIFNLSSLLAEFATSNKML